ncbi:MAG: antitoxin YefM [Actinomycetota bacterium]|nr:antitoxin YefM [Actinomycetota bacterium]
MVAANARLDKGATRPTRSALHEPVVVVSLEDYESLKETAYLMRSPANARRLLSAMERLEAGRGVAHDLVVTD